MRDTCAELLITQGADTYSTIIVVLDQPPRSVRREGFEPPTRCLEGSRSVHLSYRRARQ
jgi:hypothetical protein